MATKRLIEKETINKVYKAIEVHIKLLRESDIYLGNEFQKKRFIKSVEYLETMLHLLKPIDLEFKELTREAYINYKNAKAKVEEYKNTKNINKEELKKLEHEEEMRLKIYLVYKKGDNNKVDK